ncbi:ABC transporter ATP-binding protein [Pedobacter segetis]|nr:ABC transporter ATP-binding protein [Pedobacter segetis]
MSSIIQLKNLSKNYGTKVAVDNLNLDISKGEIFGLLGPNGAGKTTTILMMLGLTEPSSGNAMVCGFDATSNPINVKKRVGYMPDSVGFYDNLTALENLEYIGRLNGIDEKELSYRAVEVMEIVGLGQDMHLKTGAYSRGMKQRLGLADVLIKRPEVIILDEPTLGIDPSGVRDFLLLIKQLSRENGLTVLLSSHHLHHVQQVCDQVGIFVKGKLLVKGNIASLSEKLFAGQDHVTWVDLEEKITGILPHENELLALEGIKAIKVEGQSIEFTCNRRNMTPLIVRTLAERGYNILGVRQRNYGLEEIYQKYFENSLTENTVNEKSSSVFKKSFFSRFSK